MTILEELPVSRIDVLEALWRRLNAHHRAQAPAFDAFYAARTWDERRAELLTKANAGRIRILVAFAKDRTPLAYCVATVSAEGLGELDSLFVDESLRSRGLGQELAEHALRWMSDAGAQRKRVVVYSGNERAMGLYRRLGFAPRQVLMEIPSSPG